MPGRLIALLIALGLSVALGGSVAAQAGPVRPGAPVTYVASDGVEQGSVTVTELADPFTDFQPDLPPQSGMKYVLLTLTIAGTGTDGLEVGLYTVWLRDSAGVLWQRTIGLPAIPVDFPQPELMATTVGPGSQISGYVAYMIPDDVSVEEVLFQPDPGVLLIPAGMAGVLPSPATSVTMTSAEGGTVIAKVKNAKDPYKRFRKNHPPVNGARFVMITVSLRNGGETPFDFEASRMVLRDARGAMWAPTSIRPARRRGVAQLGSVGLGPGNHVTGWLGYQVPADVGLDGVYYQGSGRLFRLANLANTSADGSGVSP